MTEYKRKLIEVALPLEAINRASAHEKSIRHGHPSTMHLWWARRPLAACRAVLFASLVDDPSADPEEFPTDEAQERERQRLFAIIEDLVKWENSTNEAVLDVARSEIMRSTNGNPPPVLDPFCGGGSIPLEAQRLGLEAYASDLNPVAVLMTKALIEIPPRFAGLPPVNPESHGKLSDSGWRGAQGLAEDVRYYGRWMRDQAEQRIGHLYPKVRLPAEKGGGEATVIAWLWTRTVKCPNPACGAQMPLVRSFALSTKKGKQAWVEPIIDASTRTVAFEVREGTGVPPEGTVSRQGARCVVCGNSVPFTHIRTEGQQRGLGVQLMAVVAEGSVGRVYLAPDEAQVAVAEGAVPRWEPEADLPHNPRDFKTPNYGLTRFADLFTNRQLAVLECFGDLIAEAGEHVLHDSEIAWAERDASSTAFSGDFVEDYRTALTVYLAEIQSKAATFHNTMARWRSGEGKSAPAFGRQAIPMVWDFTEVNPFAGAGGDFMGVVEGAARAISRLPAGPAGFVEQLDAGAERSDMHSPVVSTDPPYYDNIGYADLSDFFYLWLRHSLESELPTLFSTLLTPKSQELIATPYRHGGDRLKAQAWFEARLGDAFIRINEAADPDYPISIYYAFKQAESQGDSSAADLASTGWETMLSGLLRAGLAITGTWPMRTEGATRMMAMHMNALATSVVLVCRPRPASAPLATRKEFIAALRSELPEALKNLQHGNIAPVDLAQASIGPGMAVFSRYAKVMETDGSQMPVRAALALINQALDEILAEQEGEFDSSTRWAVAWFEQFGSQAGEYGVAETLCRAKNCSVEGMVRDGFLEARGGKVRLLRRDELDEDWDPAADQRPTVWEMTQHLLRRLDEGEVAAAGLARRLGSFAEVARDLAYRLYLICERKKWAQEALAYNALVVAWPQIQQLAANVASSAETTQEELF